MDPRRDLPPLVCLFFLGMLHPLTAPAPNDGLVAPPSLLTPQLPTRSPHFRGAYLLVVLHRISLDAAIAGGGPCGPVGAVVADRDRGPGVTHRVERGHRRAVTAVDLPDAEIVGRTERGDPAARLEMSDTLSRAFGGGTASCGQPQRSDLTGREDSCGYDFRGGLRGGPGVALPHLVLAGQVLQVPQVVVVQVGQVRGGHVLHGADRDSLRSCFGRACGACGQPCRDDTSGGGRSCVRGVLPGPARLAMPALMMLTAVLSA